MKTREESAREKAREIVTNWLSNVGVDPLKDWTEIEDLLAKDITAAILSFEAPVHAKVREKLENMKHGSFDGRSQDDWAHLDHSTLTAILATLEVTRRSALALLSAPPITDGEE